MNYRKKLKNRLYIAIGYLVIGAAMAAVSAAIKSDNAFFVSYGIALMVCGVVRIIKHFRLVADDEAVRRQETAEKDERNLMLRQKSQSAAFSIYIMLSFLAMLAFQLMDMQSEAAIVAFSICLLVAVYYVSYCVISRKY